MLDTITTSNLFEIMGNLKIKRGYLDIIALECESLGESTSIIPKDKDGNAIK